MTIVLLKYTKSNSITMFENLLKLSQIFKNSQILIIFGIFKEFLSTQNVNVARFARNVECDFLADFQTLWPSPI